MQLVRFRDGQGGEAYGATLARPPLFQEGRAGTARLLPESHGGTLIRDDVLYRMPYGALGTIARRIVGARDLERIFDYRRDAVDRLLDGRRTTLATAVSGG